MVAAMNSLLSRLRSASVVSLSTPVAANDAAGAWLRLVPAGSFTARDGRGPFVAGSKADMEAIVARTRQYHGGIDIVVDYDHQSVFGVKDGVGGTARAAGWIKELQVRDDGIYGRIEWTEAAASAIRAGEYRYLSPVIPAEKKTGRIALLLNAAITNVPALDLEAVAASALFPELNDEGTAMDKIAKALGLPDGADEAAVLAAIAALGAVSTALTAIAAAAGLAPDAKPGDIQAAAAAALADRQAFTAAAGLQAGADRDAILAVLRAGPGSVVPDPAKYVPIAAVTELRDQLNQLTATLSADKAEEAVSAAMRDGKLTPAMRDWGIALFKSDRGAFDAFVAGAPKLTAPQLTAPKLPSDGVAALTAEQEAVAKMLGIDPKDYAATLKSERQPAL